MCVAYEELPDGGGMIGGVEPTIQVIAPTAGISTIDLSSIDWANLQAQAIVTPDPDLLHLVVPGGPVAVEVDLSDLGPIGNLWQMHGGSSYAVIP